MKWKRVVAVFSAAALLVTSLSGCLSTDPTKKKIIRIGVFEPLTGENGGGGFQEVLGMRYANKMYPTVTIQGEEYKVELDEVDNKSDKTEAITAAQRLVSDWCTVVLGSYGSGVSIAAGQIFADAHIPAIGASCTNPQVTLGNDYYFRIAYLDPFQGTIMANYAKQSGAKRAAVITQLGDDYSSGLGSYFVQAFQGDGVEVVRQEQFQTNQSDFKAILTNIKAQKPDFIFAPSSITTAPLIIKQARELGITAVLGAGDTWENSTIIENAGSSAEGIVFSTFFDEAAPSNEEGRKFVQGFKQFLVENKQEDIIPAMSALAYDSYLVAIKAIEKANSTDKEAIREALKGITVDGVTGTISFDENGDAKKDMAYIKTVKNGKFQFLTTTKVEKK
ncbi:MAG: ABC transporter substrate-binding protein [Lachnospiraceae bacterium]|nr:ABC transporter substrate-binding protein [Lachnospiraceae bacterium]